MSWSENGSSRCRRANWNLLSASGITLKLSTSTGIIYPDEAELTGTRWVDTNWPGININSTTSPAPTSVNGATYSGSLDFYDDGALNLGAQLIWVITNADPNPYVFYGDILVVAR